MTLVLSQSPETEPVTLEDVKTHLRLDHETEDELLNSLIVTAREYLEQQTQLALMTQTWRLCLDNWPLDKCIKLYKSPVQSIDQIEQFDASGTGTLISTSEMLLDSNAHPARLYINAQSAPLQVINGIEITFTAGFQSASEVPDMLKRALLIHIANMYEFRGVVSANMQPAAVPQGYLALISPWVRRSI